MVSSLHRVFYAHEFLKIKCAWDRKFRRLEKHYKCLNDYYPETNNTVTRCNIADQEISWFSKPFLPPYNPRTYTAKVVLDRPDWADPELDDLWLNSKPKWNLDVGTYSRVCHHHHYLVNASCPLNPIGRTGLKGRGLLGRWGPNQAVHAIIARWKRDGNYNILKDPETNKPLFQFISVKRYDADLWSVPGRFIRGKDRFLLSLKKLVFDELLNNFKNYSEQQRKFIVPKLSKFLSDGDVIYLGYVDDPRNTDNAWVSTHAVLFLDTGGNITNTLRLDPGPSVSDVKWMDAVDLFDIESYGNHEDFIKDTADHLDAYYPFTDEEKEKLKKEANQYGSSGTISLERPSETFSESKSK